MNGAAGASWALVLSYRPAMLMGMLVKRLRIRSGFVVVALGAAFFGALSGCVSARGPVVQSGGSGVGQSSGAGGTSRSAGAASNGVGESVGVSATPGAAVVDAIRKGPLTANGMVTHLVDGDTVDIRFGEPGAKVERVRLIGIDTPETKRPNTPVECFGREASSALAALIPIDTPVLVERDVEERDRYGRLLGYIFRASDGLFVNHEMVRAGMALPYTFPPNVAYVDVFGAAGDASRSAAVGLWSRCETGHTPA